MSDVASPKIIFSNTNIDSRVGVRLMPSWIGQFAQDAGFDGVEWRPTIGTAGLLTAAVHSGALVLNSLHQSPRTNYLTAATNDAASAQPNTLGGQIMHSPISRLLQPEMTRSVRSMGEISQKTKTQYPGIYFPQRRHYRDKENIMAGDSSPALFQPTDYAARILLAAYPQPATTQNLVHDAEQRGYGKTDRFGIADSFPFCLDTFLVQRRYGNREAGVVSELNRSLGVLAAKSYAVHVSLNRSELASREPHVPTRQDLVYALAGRFTGSLGDILDAAKESGNVRYAVIEATTRDVAEVTGHERLRDLKQDYAQLAAHLRDRLAA